MELEKKVMLLDYVNGLRDLGETPSFFVGAVIAPKGDAEAVRAALEADRVAVLRPEDGPDAAAAELIARIVKGEIVAVDLENGFPAKMREALDKLVNGQVHLQVAGSLEPIVLNPVPTRGKAVVLLSPERFAEESFGDMLLTACRLDR